MRVLLLSDIHSNLEALEACLAAAPPHDIVVNLGDVVGYGASPNQVIERSRSLGNIFVRGNHDKAASGAMDLRDFNPIAGLAALWTRDQLTPENLHLQGSFSTNNVASDYLRPQYNTVGQGETAEFPLKDSMRYLINPGSVGQPRDGDWRAAFAVFDSSSRVVTFCRVPYNLKQAQDRILTANLPQRLATRLAAGR